MMPAVQVGPGAGSGLGSGTGPGAATAAAAGNGPGLGRTPAEDAGSDGGGFGSALRAAMADASPGAQGQEPAPAAVRTGAATGVVAPAGRRAPGLPAKGAAAGEGLPAEGGPHAAGGRVSAAGENETFSVTKSGDGSLPVAGRDGIENDAAQSAAAAGDAAMVAGTSSRTAVGVNSAGLEDVPVMIATAADAPDAGANAAGDTGRTSGGGAAGKAGGPGGKTDANKAEPQRGAGMQAQGLPANAGAILAAAGAAVNPGALPQGALPAARARGARERASGEEESMVGAARIGATTAGVPAARWGAAGARIPAGTAPSSNARATVAGDAAQAGSVRSGLKEVANGAGVAVQAAAAEAGGPGPAANVGARGVHPGDAPAMTGQGSTGPGGVEQGGSGLTATHLRDGSAGAAGTGSTAGGGFAATLLQFHPGAGMGAETASQAGATTRSVSAGAAGTANPYVRMDEPQRASLVYASAQKMTVTVSDPSLGSFEVRAQGGGAQVAARLATASAATHAQLSGHLPSLTAFLQDQRLDVSRVTVVRQSVLSGDGAPRDFGGQQRHRQSRSRDAGAGGVEAVGAAGAPGPAGTAAAGESAPPAEVGGSPGGSDAGLMSYVDVLA